MVQAEALAEPPCQGWGTCVCTFVGTPRASLGHLRGLGFFYIQVFPICFEMQLVGSKK